MTVEEFIEKWERSGAAERANCQTFLNELCAIIGTAQPNPTSGASANDTYVYERAVKDPLSGTTKFIDLYKRGCFVLEAKQGSEKKQKIADPRQQELLTGEAIPEPTKTGTAVRGTPGWAKAMESAKRQAYNYARALDTAEGWPPFLIVVDIGHVMEIYSDFSGIGKNYTQFQDGRRFRITLEDLHDEEVRQTLKQIWEDPHSLDPSKHSAKVTRQIAERLAALGKSFQEQGHDSELVARFLMRCLFTMFAEDVELIPKDSFTSLLIELRDNSENVKPSLENLWEVMDKGGFSPVLKNKLLRFNGGLFKENSALPVNNMQLGLLIDAASADWGEVEPAIFGTLLERALSSRDRHKLGAHYTPRAYVERLVTPTIVEPLRADWDAVKAAAFHLADKGDQKGAIKAVQDFHHELCTIRVLDPACGSGNFLYVALEMMKRLEGEVLDVLTELGETQARLGLSGETVDPHQFLGIELNPWAANVAELVLWIGYLQWHFRTHGQAAPSEPVLRDFKNIQNADAILTWEGTSPRMDENEQPATRWDGVTTMRHPVTGEEVPDPSAKIQIYDYQTPKPTVWPEADFIVGNPPFIGASRLRDNLGDGYVEALWKVYPKMPQSADLVMFWWEKAALAARAFNAKTSKGTRRFGLITTNSLRQTFNRRVLEPHLNDPKKPLSLLFAIPDHPWVDTLYGAAVRIAMTVGAAGNRSGRLLSLATESKEKSEADGKSVTFDHQVGKVLANLQVGPDVIGCKPLMSNKGLAHMGMKLHGAGFIVTKEEAIDLADGNEQVFSTLIRPYMNGRDLAQSSRGLFSIDLYPLSEEEVRSGHPKIYQHVKDNVKPERDHNREPWRKKHWWWYGRTHEDLRAAAKDIENVIATTRTAKHRLFSLLPSTLIAESKIVVISLDDWWQQAVLSSRIHEVFALAAGGWLGFGNDPTYNHSDCFNKFPFPDPTDAQKACLRALGEELDAHRKRQQASHPKLTLTSMYNVLEKLRAGETIEGKDREIYDQGLIGILKDLHDQIDAAVAEAYGWPVDLSDEDILQHLVDLNRERHLEEIGGHIRWLRPDYQNPGGEAQASKTGELALEKEVQVEGQHPWPKDLPEQMSLIRAVLSDLGSASVEDVRKQFKRGQSKQIRERLETLAMLGQAEKIEGDKYAA